MISKRAAFSYPVYFLDKFQIFVAHNAKDVDHLEFWVFYEEPVMKAFDANFLLLSHRDVPFSGGAFELYIDDGIDHSGDSILMRSLLIDMLTNLQTNDPKDYADIPRNFRQLEVDQLLPIVIKYCPM